MFKWKDMIVMVFLFHIVVGDISLLMKYIVECLEIENAIVDITSKRVFLFWKYRRK